MLNNQSAKPAQRASLWTRILTAWSRSFDLLAESKARFPMEV
jgi:hypothetical protein